MKGKKLEPHAATARRTSRRRKLSRRYLDAGLSGPVETQSAYVLQRSLRRMRSRQSQDTQQRTPATPQFPRRRTRRSTKQAGDEDSDYKPYSKPKKRPRTQPGRSKKHSENVPSAKNASADLPNSLMVRLWDNTTKRLQTEPVPLPDLCGALAKDQTLSLYMGQSSSNFPQNLRNTMLSQEDVDAWSCELSTAGLHRRVMIFNPNTLTVLPHSESPTVSALEQFMRRVAKQQIPSKQLRLYAGEHTSFLFLSDDVRNYVQRICRSHCSMADGPPSLDGDADCFPDDNFVLHDRDIPKVYQSDSCDDEPIISASACLAYLDGDGSEPDIECLPSFRSQTASPEGSLSVPIPASQIDNSSTEGSDSNDPQRPARSNADERRRWVLLEDSSGSDESIFDQVFMSEAINSDRDSYSSQERDSCEEGEAARVVVGPSSYTARIEDFEEPDKSKMSRSPSKTRVITNGKQDGAQVCTEPSLVPDIVFSRGQTKSYGRTGRGGFRTNPVGPDEIPVESKSYSTDVYIWNYDEHKRTDVLVPLDEAVEICKRSTSPFLGIYDGQDYDFEGGPLSHTLHIFPYDIVRWANRGVAKDRRVRIWNRSQRSFRAHQFCPMLSRLAVWLKLNPDLAIFDPSMMNPLCTARTAVVGPALRSCLAEGVSRSSLMFRRLVRRIHQTGVTKINVESLSRLEFWNTTKKCKELRNKFFSRGELALFLLANPWIEIYSGQDEVGILELSLGFYLTPIHTNCPAQLASFWNKRDAKKYIQPTGIPEFAGRTIYDCLRANDSLELYLGQDTDQQQAIADAIQRAEVYGSFPYAYMLAYCGELGHQFLSKGWAAVHVDVSNRNTGCAVFWDIKERSLRMQPDIASFSSIDYYLCRHSGATELYTGQNLCSSVQKDLSVFFTILTFRPGYNCRSHRPMLTRQTFVPSATFLREELGRKFSVANHSSEVSEKPSKDSSGPRTDGRRKSGRMSELHTGKEKLKAQSEEPTATRGEVRSVSTELAPPEMPTSKSNDEASSDLAFDAYFSSDGKDDESIGVPAPRTLEITTSNDEDEPTENLECQFPTDDRMQWARNASPPVEMPCSNSWDALISKAKEKASKISSMIREAGPKILNRQLKQDICQSLREDLLLAVDSSASLLALASRARSPDFIFAAFKLCMRLEALDALDCFSSFSVYGYGPPDLSSIRSDLEAGKIFGIAGVVKKFRHVCVDLCHYNQDNALVNEAVILQHNGEQRIHDFFAENHDLVVEEGKILSVANICERAKKIGFQENRVRRSSRKAPYQKSPPKAQPSIRVPGYQSQVTFYNYRDEKGYSVMGKRHSARVLGLSIDLRASEARAGNVRPCHVCKRRLFQSKGDYLQCSNHKFDVCKELVCRSCLESTLSLSEAEFHDWRKRDNWICIHCRGLCVERPWENGSHYHLLRKSRELSEVEVQFNWHICEMKASSVALAVVRRLIGGQFSSLADGLSIALTKVGSGKEWHAKAKLPVGAYRCRVDVDEIWKYSTTFQVLPVSKYLRKMYRQSNSASTAKQESVSSTRNEVASAKRHIEWKKREAMESEISPVHSFSQHGGGSFVGNCSRTEGYDWQRAKRHAIVHWIPEISQEPTTEWENGSSTRSQEITFHASTEVLPGSVEMDEFPRLKVGMSWRRFEHEVHAFKFDYMRSETLWGVLTGTSRIHGVGLFTQTGYQKGDFVIEYAGDVIRTPLGDLREKRYDAEGLGTYLFKIDEHKIVDATVKSNRARFTNHSCDPNMAAKIVNVRGRDLVVLLATRNIPPFAELTFNYQLPYEDKKIECLCNSWNCVGVMN